MATSAVRPKLQARAITEIGPLVEREGFQDAQDLGRGTHAAVGGGSKLAGGGRLPRGAWVPNSPFLPLPPAPTEEELKQQEAATTPRVSPLTNRPIQPSAKVGRSASNFAHPYRGKARSLPPSCGMIRSFSLPVATQKEFEQQRKLFEQGRDAGSSASSQWSSGWPMSPATSAIDHAQHTIEAQHMQGSPQRTPMSPLALNAQLSADPQADSIKTVAFGGSILATHEETDADNADDTSPPLRQGDGLFDDETTPASMYGMEELSPQVCDGSYFAPKSFDVETTGNTTDRFNRSPTESISDGPPTPRAGTPSDQVTSMKMSFSKQQWGSHVRNDTVDDEVNGGFIHPEHLAPPTAT